MLALSLEGKGKRQRGDNLHAPLQHGNPHHNAPLYFPTQYASNPSMGGNSCATASVPPATAVGLRCHRYSGIGRLDGSKANSVCGKVREQASDTARQRAQR